MTNLLETFEKWTQILDDRGCIDVIYESFSNYGTVSRFLCPRGSNHVLNILPIYILLTSKQWGLIVVVRSFTATLRRNHCVKCDSCTVYAATLTF